MPTSAPTTDDPFLKGVFENPIIKQLQAGDVPPIYVTPQAFGPHAADLLPKLEQGLPQIGLGVVNAPKSGVLVAFNPQIYRPEEILKADAAGQLDKIALPLQTQYTQGAAGASGAPAAPAAPGVPSDAQPAAPAPSIAAGLLGGSNPNTDPLQRERAQAMTPQPPVKKPLPSQGILNGLLSRAS